MTTRMELRHAMNWAATLYFQLLLCYIDPLFVSLFNNFLWYCGRLGETLSLPREGDARFSLVDHVLWRPNSTIL